MNHEDTRENTKGTRRGPLSDFTERVATEIVDSAFKVHSTLGPGLLESVYETCLSHELVERGVLVERQIVVPVTYGTLEVQSPLKLDLRVGGCVLVELKAVEVLLPVHRAQLLTYLRLSKHRLGFLLNFNVHRLKNGIQRIIL